MASILRSEGKRERYIEASLVVLFFALGSLMQKGDFWMLTGALCWIGAISVWFLLCSIDVNVRGLKNAPLRNEGYFGREKNEVTA